MGLTARLMHHDPDRSWITDLDPFYPKETHLKQRLSGNHISQMSILYTAAMPSWKKTSRGATLVYMLSQLALMATPLTKYLSWSNVHINISPDPFQMRCLTMVSFAIEL